MAAIYRARPVQSRIDRRRFIDFPYTFYKDYPHWVPPLRMDIARTINPKKNAFFEHGRMQLFLAEDNTGAVVGRIGSIVNGMHLRKYDDGNGFFGFFECIEDYTAAEALLDAAAAWLREQGMTGVRGPANPSLNDTAGLLVAGFDRKPSILMPYNPPYYEDYLTRYGFERAMTMWAYYVHDKLVHLDKLRRGVAIVKRRNPGITLRHLDMDRFAEDAGIVRDIYNEAWSENWGHVPMTDGEFAHLAKDLKQIVEPGLVYILEDEGTPVAFSVTLPNLNQALAQIPDGRLFPFGLLKLLAAAKLGAINEVRMPLLGVRKSYHGRGFDALLILETIDRGRELGYLACETSWVLDANQVLKNAITSVGGVVDKEYAMFERNL
jgi:GNAT superfamily N-acetyltransferase